MRVLRTRSEFQEHAGGDLGFVPTMGAFHEGHLSLMREAMKSHERTCVSLFVNPLQFGQGEDFSRYPRDEERDFRLAREVGVDLMFAPDVNEIYPRNSTTIHVPEITDLWEGASRPGHFDGVATVVSKLLNIVQPRTAYFGWKDLQQCLVIQRMVEDLNTGIHLSFQETVREPDGLALSSRNAYLDPERRATAPKLYETLVHLSQIAGEGLSADSIEQKLDEAREKLTGFGFDVIYLELVSALTLTPLREGGSAAVIAAARLGSTRLIDNVRFDLVQAR